MNKNCHEKPNQTSLKQNNHGRKPMVKVSDITFGYKHSPQNILESISFDIEKNQCIAVLGNNGAGKSTLIKCLDRINAPQEGAVLVDNNNVFAMKRNQLAQNISYVPQSQNSGSFNMTVFDAILLGRKPYIKWYATAKDKAIVAHIIKKMDLEKLALRNLRELSGGERQKVMLAKALAQEPKLLLLDEPTSNLDPRNQHEVLSMVRKVAQEQNICVALVIHDLNLAIRYCDRFLFLKDAHVFAYGDEKVMSSENIKKVYNIDVHIANYNNIPVIIPYLEEDNQAPWNLTLTDYDQSLAQANKDNVKQKKLSLVSNN